MEILIHPTAIIDARAQLDSTVQVGPYAVIGPHVQIGAGTQVGPHVVLQGHTRIGSDNHIHAHACLGGDPQDKKYLNEPTCLEIGSRNTIREFCTFNVGTIQDEGVTRIGDDNWIMAYVHVAHDCVVGSHTILANNATLAGHVKIDDWVILGGLTGVHQFTKVGAHAMAGFASHVSQDVPPFMMVDGNPLSVRGFNIEGLRRRSFDAERLSAVKKMHRLLYRDNLTLQSAQQSIERLKEDMPGAVQEIELMLEFLHQSSRGIVR